MAESTPEPTASPPVARSSRLALAGVVLLGLVVRLAHFLLYADPFAGTPIKDAAYNEAWAKRILAGETLHRVFPADPLYAYVLAAIRGLFGDAPAPVVLIQIALDSAHVAVIWALAARVLGDRRVALVAGLLAALYEPYVFFPGLAIKTTLSILLVDGALLLAVLAAQRPRSRLALAFGVALGLATLVRPNLLLVLPVFLAASLAFFPWDRAPGAPRLARARFVLAACVGTALPIAPVTAHNWLEGHELVLISANFGINAYIGNNPSNPDSGLFLSPPEIQSNPLTEEEEWTRLAERRLGHPVGLKERESYWLGEALRFCKERPGLFLERTGHRALLLWNAYELPDDADIQFARESVPWFLRGPFPLATFALLAPLGFAGAALAGLRSPDRRFLALYVIGYGASLLPFVVFDRYRVQMIGPLFPFAALALVRLADLARRGRSSAAAASPELAGERPGRALAAGLAGLVLVHLPVVAAEPYLARDCYDVAVLRNQEQKPDEAMALLDRALALDPGLPQAHLERGIAHARRREYDLARADYTAATEGRDDVAGLALLNLGSLEAALGDREAARQAYLRAIPRLEWNPEAQRLASDGLARLGR